MKFYIQNIVITNTNINLFNDCLHFVICAIGVGDGVGVGGDSLWSWSFQFQFQFILETILITFSLHANFYKKKIVKRIGDNMK